MTTQTMPVGDAPEAVAIIGMSGRFPGAGNLAEFWENLRAGRETISRFAPEEMEPASAREAALMRNPAYVPARGVLEGADTFDAAFFGILPNEAEVMDPQHRVFLECAWHALEDAGYDPGSPGRSVGVFAGMSNNSYFAAHVLGQLLAHGAPSAPDGASNAEKSGFVAKRTGSRASRIACIFSHTA